MSLLAMASLALFSLTARWCEWPCCSLPRLHPSLSKSDCQLEGSSHVYCARIPRRESRVRYAMLRCVARIVDRAACNGEAALGVSRFRSSGHRLSGLALGPRRKRHLSPLQGCKYRVLLSSKVLPTDIHANKCSSSACRHSETCSEY
jgi:hypothetical protein